MGSNPTLSASFIVETQPGRILSAGPCSSAVEYVYQGRDTLTGRPLGDYLLVDGILCAAAVISTVGSIGGPYWVTVWSWSQAQLVGELTAGRGIGLFLTAWVLAYLVAGVLLWFLTERVVELRTPGKTWARAWLAWLGAQTVYFVTILGLVSAEIVVVE